MGVNMNDQELDLLLQEAAPRATERAESLARSLAIVAGGRANAKRRLAGRRPLVVAGGAVAATFLLMAAGTTSAYLLSIPPFQDMDAKTQRLSAPISVDWTRDTGKPETCRLYMEFEGLSDEQLSEANALAADTDWSPIVTATVGNVREGEDSLDAVYGALKQEFFAKARVVVPDLSRPGEATGGPMLAGYAATCLADDER